MRCSQVRRGRGGVATTEPASRIADRFKRCPPSTQTTRRAGPMSVPSNTSQKLRSITIGPFWNRGSARTDAPIAPPDGKGKGGSSERRGTKREYGKCGQRVVHTLSLARPASHLGTIEGDETDGYRRGQSHAGLSPQQKAMWTGGSAHRDSYRRQESRMTARPWPPSGRALQHRRFLV